MRHVLQHIHKLLVLGVICSCATSPLFVCPDLSVFVLCTPPSLILMLQFVSRYQVANMHRPIHGLGPL